MTLIAKSGLRHPCDSNASKSKHLCLLIRKIPFGGFETDFVRRYNGIKLEILANMTLNVILTLIALITVLIVSRVKYITDSGIDLVPLYSGCVVGCI